MKITKRPNPTKSYLYLFLVFISTTVLFSASFAAIIIEHFKGFGWAFSFGFVISTAASGIAFMLYSQAIDEDADYGNILDRNLRAFSLKKVFFIKDVAQDKAYYYPAINKTLVPVLSAPVFFHGWSLFVSFLNAALFFIGAKIMYDGNAFILTLGLIVASLILNALMHIIANADSYLALRKIEKNAGLKFAEIHYTESFISKKNWEVESLIIVNCSEAAASKRATARVMDFKKMYKKSTQLAREVNNLIRMNSSAAKVFKGDVETLNYINNDFIIGCIKTAKELYDGNVGNEREATTFFLTNIAPSISEQRAALEELMDNIQHNIKSFEQEQTGLNRKPVKLTTKALSDIKGLRLPLAEYPDFCDLRFDNLENEVIAKRIASNTIPELLELRHTTHNPLYVGKIDEKIEKAKRVVKGLASGTEESMLKQQRKRQEMQLDPLFIDNGAKEYNDIESRLSATDRYLDQHN